jgi:8-oxo-dGTP pyrophosphatase MutT (NUDIX family)
MAKIENEKHYVGVVAQKAIIENDKGQVLLVQYPAGDPAAGLWDFPGGRLNEGESSIEGIKREVLEEIGVEINIDGIMATGINKGPVFTSFFVIYKASLVDPKQSFVKEDGEIEAIEWKDKKEVFTLPFSAPGFRDALKDILV